MGRKRKTRDVALEQLTPAKRPAKSGQCGTVRSSTRGRWRALALIGVHVAFAFHLYHWYTHGKTMTPVEPSEAMQTLGTEALVNAGFVLFVITILSTLIFGRFFCGWGCHLVAYQDLCTWLLKKVRITVKPFRSRLLVFVPLGAAIFMFVMPTVVRVIMGAPRARYSSHFSTYDFWDRFPGWFVGGLTIFVCGFAIVYFLGNKGFCTYACPYGGFFGLADRFAPGKIRVTDDCEQCGHCTAACSSNVRVHEEVNLYKMVTDPGCMKCMDCISVCPKNALYFGFGKASPTVAPTDVPEKRFDFTWREEIALGAIFLMSVVVLRKLYDGVPFLLALALASISAYAILSAARLLYAPHVRFARFQLRAKGTLRRAGKIFAVVIAVWIAFLAHSAVIQVLTVSGRMALNKASSVSGLRDERAQLIARDQLNTGIALLEKADSIGIVPVANVLFDLSTAYAGRNEPSRAMACLERALAFAPQFAAGRYELATLLRKEGRPTDAIQHLRQVVEDAPEFPHAHSDLATLLIESNESREAVATMEGLIADRPDVVEFHLALGLALAHDGALDRAIEVMQHTADQWPTHPDAYYNLGATLMTDGQNELAYSALSHAVALNPKSGIIHFKLAQLADQLGRSVDAHVKTAHELDPLNAEYVRAWVIAVHRRGATAEEITTAEHIADHDRAARFRLMYLYMAAGRNEEARRLSEEFGPNGSDP
jgi:tetratricopeptide (TPR) repeat protein/ferredoxin